MGGALEIKCQSWQPRDGGMETGEEGCMPEMLQPE
jgi:hypothetical protein